MVINSVGLLVTSGIIELWSIVQFFLKKIIIYKFHFIIFLKHFTSYFINPYTLNTHSQIPALFLIDFNKEHRVLTFYFWYTEANKNILLVTK